VRLFVAVDPPPPVKARLSSLPRPARRDVRWTTPDQWHVTLRFLGEVADPAPVVDALDALADHPGADAVVARMGPSTAWFPGGRVLQVRVDGLDRLAARVWEVTTAWAPEQPDFRGHLTLARARGRDPGPAELAGAPFTATFAVHQAVLYASTLAPGGSIYRTVAAVGLGGPGDG